MRVRPIKSRRFIGNKKKRKYNFYRPNELAEKQTELFQNIYVLVTSDARAQTQFKSR